MFKGFLLTTPETANLSLLQITTVMYTECTVAFLHWFDILNNAFDMYLFHSSVEELQASDMTTRHRQSKQMCLTSVVAAQLYMRHQTSTQSVMTCPIKPIMMCLIRRLKVAAVWQSVVNQTAHDDVSRNPGEASSGVTVCREPQISEFQTADDHVSRKQGEASSGVTVCRESQISEFQTAHDGVSRKQGEASSGVTVCRESQISEFQTADDYVSRKQGEASSGVTVCRESQISEFQTAHDDVSRDLSQFPSTAHSSTS